MVHSPCSASWRAKRGANLRPIAPSPRRRLPSWRSAAWSPLPRARVTGLVPAYSLRADAGVAARVVAAHRAPEHSSSLALPYVPRRSGPSAESAQDSNPKT
jgi:hypothetical protein